MPTKYQVFVSSTFTDLIEERQAVSRAVLDIGHIPAGMEMFPAADVEQLTYIRKVIDECDYYVLIMGARYGSVDENGVSYTEREYEYAVESGKTVLVFIHNDMDQIALGKTDKDDQKREKLLKFIGRVSTGRLVQRWSSPMDLRANVIVALQQAISETPQIGWVRANTIAAPAAMADIIKYREENDKLRSQLNELKSRIKPVFSDAAELTEKIKFNYTYYNYRSEKDNGSKILSFREFIKCVGPVLHTPSNVSGVVHGLEAGLAQRHGAPQRMLSAVQADVQDALLHLVATGHVKMWAAQNGVTGYQLTPLGVRVWQEDSYVRAAAAASE